MKATAIIPPAVALMLVGSWVVPQRVSMAALETDCARLRTNIAAAKSQSSAKRLPHDPLEARRKIIGWTNIAAHFPSNPRGSSKIHVGALPDMRVTMRFRQRMEAMSADEIIAMLDEISALDLPTESRDNLEWTLLDALVRKEPGLALDQIDHRIGMESYQFGNLICEALQTWAQKVPAAAGGWFDQQIAAGKFKAKSLNGVNNFRQMNESALIGILLGSSPEAAARRLAALPEDQRGDVLRMYSLTTVPEENQVAHAQLIRAQVPAKDQAETLAAQASFLFKPGDFSAVTAYLDRIDATPAERAACAMQAVQNINPGIGSDHLTREDIDGLREWVGNQAPDALAVVTGKTLGEAAQGNRKMEFAAAAELAAEYSAESGNDEVLAIFLTSQAARANQTAARALTEKISDETRRAEILNLLK